MTAINTLIARRVNLFLRMAGGGPPLVVVRVTAGQGAFGYNAATGDFGDVMGVGIIDPTKVTRLGLQNAASIASLMLTTDCIIVKAPKHGAPALEDLPQGD